MKGLAMKNTEAKSLLLKPLKSEEASRLNDNARIRVVAIIKNLAPISKPKRVEGAPINIFVEPKTSIVVNGLRLGIPS